MNYVVALRTHYWDEQIAFLYESVKHSISDKYDLYLLCDETKGEVEVPEGVNKIGFTKQILTLMGLLDFPKDRSIWRNGDYALYILKRLVPNADAYLLLENDVLAKSKVLFQKIDAFFEQGGDLVMSAWNPGQANNVGKVTALNFYPEGVRYGFMHIWFWGASASLADRLLEERRSQRVWHRPNQENAWPSDEVFLGTFFHNHKDYQILQIRDQLYQDIHMHLGFTASVHVFEDNYLYETDNLLIHPVLKVADIFDKRWWSASLGPEFHKRFDYTANTGYGRAFLLSDKKAETYNHLIKGMIRYRHHDQHAFAKYADANGLTHKDQLDFTNKAFLRPVSMSSSMDNKKVWEADGASLTDGNYDSDKYRFGGAATKVEDEPWLCVDLGLVVTFEQIILYHRDVAFDRTSDIRLSVSKDGQYFEDIADYHQVQFKKVPTTRNKAGYLYRFDMPIARQEARFIKLTLLKKGTMFHLNQIEVF